MTRFRVLSYNIHKGFTVRNRDYVLADIRDAIRETDSHIVGLQEVLGEHRRHQAKWENWHPESHFEFLADSVWPHYAYGKNAIYQHGHHGNVLLSQYPFLTTRNHDISQWWFSRRGLLCGEVEIDSTKIHLACVHLGFLPYEQFRQARRIQQWLAAFDRHEPLILLGDFNDWHQRIHRFLTRKLGLQEVTSYRQSSPQATFPASRPTVAMDRIYFQGLNWHSGTVCSDGYWPNLSDHCPVLAEFSVANSI
ncbi:EEP domain-containing protein [Pseudomaricurvus alkylphenolicus]|uniref:endonuclease/exonuclease/phosphatase family protein n=1 Tax=Pseudomaricurvus alkylphenolicus TaxID=1306991 RepID=UPI001422EB05|nr:endonuclease/exonuclease/phosphatase family protein [Pseudomaricurvus alkylphenolicus]NIB43739.1 EEP domain-containing protein [Pseudomaricurvus alkylphenolicus]